MVALPCLVMDLLLRLLVRIRRCSKLLFVWLLLRMIRRSVLISLIRLLLMKMVITRN